MKQCAIVTILLGLNSRIDGKSSKPWQNSVACTQDKFAKRAAKTLQLYDAAMDGATLGKSPKLKSRIRTRNFCSWMNRADHDSVELDPKQHQAELQVQELVTKLSEAASKLLSSASASSPPRQLSDSKFTAGAKYATNTAEEDQQKAAQILADLASKLSLPPTSKSGSKPNDGSFGGTDLNSLSQAIINHLGEPKVSSGTTYATASEKNQFKADQILSAGRDKALDTGGPTGTNYAVADQFKADQILSAMQGKASTTGRPTETSNAFASEADPPKAAETLATKRGKTPDTGGPKDVGSWNQSEKGWMFHGVHIPMRETKVPLPQFLDRPIRLLEAEHGAEGQIESLYTTAGEKDAFGTKLWPMGFVCASKVLSEGVRGRTFLELGCGTGLISVAAQQGGASFVLATDRSCPNLELAATSARLNSDRSEAVFHTLQFDVTLPIPLPSRASPLAGSKDSGIQQVSFASKLPERWDVVAFSDVLYWPEETKAFGKRAAEALLQGATVIVCDPGRRRDDFIRAVKDELTRCGYDAPVQPEAAACPDDIMQLIISPQTRTGSSLFCNDPFAVVLKPADVIPVDAARMWHWED